MRPAVEKIILNVGKVFRGEREKIELALLCLLADGHLLIEDIPGVGKTLLAKALALSVDCDFRRVQFTSDLLPSDILGTVVFSQKKGEFYLRKGPVFTNILLADEINRGSPRTQSALLEAMNERKVTIEGRTLPLPEPFLVIATQNPVELHGTYPLPESQLDRFLISMSLGYPGRKEEKRIILEQKERDPLARLSPVLEKEEILRMQKEVREVRVSEEIADYILDISERTRNHPSLRLGASPRASLYLTRAAQARAYMEGRDYVVPDDVKKIASPVLVHRIFPKGEKGREELELILQQILRELRVPG